MQNIPISKDLAAIGRIDAVQRILEVVCRTTGLGFSAVARVTDTRWVACAVRDEIGFGLQPGGELELETTICNEIRGNGQMVAIDHVAEDEIYSRHPTPAKYGFQSYISVPITLADGRFFGTLCAIDPRPARVSDRATVDTFKLFADLIAMHLDAQRRLDDSERALLGARETAQLREQFIAVLGHDLRNPLAAIGTAAELLRTSQLDEEADELVDMIRRGTVRMGDLIGNLLDFARGRLGGGLPVTLSPDPNLAAALQQVVHELQTAWPGRTVRSDIRLEAVVICDGPRIAQMLSNLLANALTHGDPTGSTIVLARSNAADGFELSVTNSGPAIPQQIRDNLFQPFSRGEAQRGQEGLGLGLYIVAEIARAHGGALRVESDDGQTTFTFRIPAAPRETKRESDVPSGGGHTSSLTPTAGTGVGYHLKA